MAPEPASTPQGRSSVRVRSLSRLRRSPIGALVIDVLVPVIVLGCVVSVAGAFLAPGGGPSAVVATLVVSMLVSTLVLLQWSMALLTPKQSPLALGMALVLYSVHAAILWALLSTRESSAINPQWFGWTVVGLTAVWITLHVRAAIRVRVSPVSRE